MKATTTPQPKKLRLKLKKQTIRQLQGGRAPGKGATAGCTAPPC